MPATPEKLQAWIESARTKARAGALGEADLDALAKIVSGKGVLRQRLLYLTANGMSTYALVIAAAPREPVRKVDPPQVSADPELPYRSVYDAILDGWRVISFPNQTAPLDDRELHILGYQFILEKLEAFDD
ncbi:MAG: hypothetical protein K8S99_01845 [Planctomycetes bacterium]|nr:hypothetical protein [Planctomycetota bacterium]